MNLLKIAKLTLRHLHCKHGYLFIKYCMVGDFCGVQIFVDFVRSAYPLKISCITK